MSLLQKISDDLKAALKAKEESRLSCLRMLKAAVKNRQVELGHELKDEEILHVISSLVRKGQESVTEFRKGNREDLARKEEEEIRILYGFMPEQLTPTEIEAVLRETIAELSAGSLKDLGKVMKAALERMAGRAQGKEVNQIARRLLS